jgi:hypothetical protein
MTFLYCVHKRVNVSPGTAITWTVGYSFLSSFFVVLVLYSLIPLIRYRRAFLSLSFLNRVTRVMITVAVFLKFVGNLTAVAVGRLTYPDFDPEPMTIGKLGFCGLFSLELPAYVVSTVYTLVLLFWLLTCLELLPDRYGARFRTMKMVLLIYNFVMYALFLTSAMLLVGQSSAHIEVYSISAIARDLVLCIIFVTFYFSLKLGLREIETYMTIEVALINSTLAIAVLVLLRGILPFVQGIMLITHGAAQSRECSIGFLVWWALSELLLEGVPLWYLTRTNNGFLLETHLEETQRNTSRSSIEDAFISGA